MTKNANVKVAREFAREAVDSYNSGAISKDALDAFVKAVMAYEVQISLQEKLSRGEGFYPSHVGSKKRKLLGDLLAQ